VIAGLLWAALAFVGGPDSVVVRTVDRSPAPDSLSDSTGWGPAQVVLATRQGLASVWILRVAGDVYVAAAIPDSTYYWGDDFVLSLDTEGDRAGAPQHDDFQWYLRRALDSSVVFRGRAGRWDPPQADPDWRLGRARSGAGWDVRAAEWPDGRGWAVVLRLDAGWLRRAGAGPGLAIRIYDDAPSGWYAWPRAPAAVRPIRVEDEPSLWGRVIPTAPAATSGVAPRGGT
jgi:hypothetical protein